MIREKKLETRLALIAIVVIVIAWVVGRQLENADILSSVKAQLPGIARLEEIDKASYRTYNSENEQTGYLTMESSMGYGGPLLMAVAVDQAGKISDLAVVNSKETPSYLEKVLDSKFLERIIGKSYDEDYQLGREIDGITSATYSSRAILKASKKGNRYIAGKLLGFDIPKESASSIQFGVAEFALVLLFTMGYIAQRKTFKYTKTVRWGTMLTGLLVIGFYFNQPFTLSMVNQLLLGYLPPLHSHLYWYVLLGGIFLALTVDNKDPYCSWFCPFGAAQECLGLVGAAKHRSVGKLKNVFKWTLRTITLFAIVVALLLRNPGVTSYEVFGTLFKLTGSNLQFALLGIVLVSSVFIKRPWCNYLCPLVPINEHYRHMRRFITHKWNRRKVHALQQSL